MFFFPSWLLRFFGWLYSALWGVVAGCTGGVMGISPDLWDSFFFKSSCLTNYSGGKPDSVSITYASNRLDLHIQHPPTSPKP